MSHSTPETTLTSEEAFLWVCARHWRTPSVLASADDLDWDRVLEMSRWNRMQTLMHGVLKSTGLLNKLPARALDGLEEDVVRYREDATSLGEALQWYLSLATKEGVQTVVLKGLSVSSNIYGHPAIRPGSDIDLLVRKDQVGDSVAILERMGLGRHWPKLMDDVYYERHHLHQQRCSEDFQIWIEVHWALDHPYTLLTIDYEAVMDRTLPGELLGEPVRDLALPDLLLSLAVHLVKHAVYLPSVAARPDLARVILADGMLMYFLDVAEVVKSHEQEIDWPFTVELARRSGATTILGAVLSVCLDHLGAPVPPSVLDELPVAAPCGLTQWTMERMADYRVGTHLGQDRSRFWDLILGMNETFILRPIRVLDTTAYFFPDGDYLARRYGRNSRACAVRHLTRATAQYAQLAIDTIYYTWQRNRRKQLEPESRSGHNEPDPHL